MASNIYKNTIMVGMIIGYLVLTVTFLWVLSGGDWSFAMWIFETLKVFVPGSDFNLGEAVSMAWTVVVYALILAGCLGSVFVLILIFIFNEVVFSEPYKNEQEIIEARKVKKQFIIRNYLLACLFGVVMSVAFISGIG